MLKLFVYPLAAVFSIVAVVFLLAVRLARAISLSVAGSFLLLALVAWTGGHNGPDHWSVFLIVGVVFLLVFGVTGFMLPLAGRSVR